MSLTPIQPDSAPRPTSPWSGSQHQIRHRWQLDKQTGLGAAAGGLRELAGELIAAHAAGWELVEPMRNGHLLAARASRRQRGQAPQGPPRPARATGATPPQLPPWRLRLIDEPPGAGDVAFDALVASGTPVLSWTGRSLAQVSGPQLPVEATAGINRQVPPDLTPGRWGIAPARVGPNVDLVADGSSLRLHAVRSGVLVRTREVLTFQHAADRAQTLLEAAAAYERLARAADAMAAAGGRLSSADEGFLTVDYDERGR
jgi:hypothetical protein